MKKFHLVVFALLFATVTFAQKKEKIKGSKNVTVAQKQIGSFDTLEVEDNLEVFLVKGGTSGLEIEADENLHEIIMTELTGSVLRIYTSKNVARFKKLTVRVTYTDSLQTITAKHETTLNALAHLEVPNVTIKTQDYAKCFLNVKTGSFTLRMNDKSKGEMNLKADNSVVELSKNAELKALFACPEVKFDMYQNSEAAIEGDAANVKLRLDNSSSFKGKNFTVKNMELLAEAYSSCEVMVADLITITATGKSKVELFGTPKVEIRAFADSATIYKKEK